MINANMTLRERVHAKLADAENGNFVEFDQREAKHAGFFVEDALTLEDVEGSDDDE